jgi:hypothetical protein
MVMNMEMLGPKFKVESEGRLFGTVVVDIGMNHVSRAGEDREFMVTVLKRIHHVGDSLIEKKTNAFTIISSGRKGIKKFLMDLVKEDFQPIIMPSDICFGNSREKNVGRESDKGKGFRERRCETNNKLEVFEVCFHAGKSIIIRGDRRGTSGFFRGDKRGLVVPLGSASRHGLKEFWREMAAI